MNTCEIIDPAEGADARYCLTHHDTEGHLVDDALTLIDFADAQARAGAYLNVLPVHALAHHLIDDPDRPVEWSHLRFLADAPDSFTDSHGPAWPDVRRRMLALLDRTAPDSPVYGGAV